MPVLSAVPPLPAINVWVAQVIQHARTQDPRVAMDILHRAGMTLLRHAVTLVGSPNWAESYVEGTWLLADAYAALARRVYGPDPGWTRLGVTARWRHHLGAGQRAALDRAVPASFRNTAGFRVHAPVVAPR